MLEIPEAIILSRQLNQTVQGKQIAAVTAAASPHKFAWYYGNPHDYDALLRGRTLEKAQPYGGRVEISAEGVFLHFGDGVNLRYVDAGEKIPPKHQLLIRFTDSSVLVASVAMYGGLWVFPAQGMDDNIYYQAAKTALPPLSEAFDAAYFLTLFSENTLNMSAKAFLATEQRIPGLGNGVLQDILWHARLHPKSKISSLSQEKRLSLFDRLKTTLAAMTDKGGRDTERDLFGHPGGYPTLFSKNTVRTPCPGCDSPIMKETYLGGSIYFCGQCQVK